MSRLYLDHNATTPARPEAVDAVARAMAIVGNPSSVHAEGRAARATIEAARETVAGLLGARARDVVFTSGASEANATALQPGLRRSGDRRRDAILLAAAGEHASVLAGHRFPRHEILPLGADGVLDLETALARIAQLAADEPEVRIVVALQAANSETGAVQPVAQVAEAVRRAGGVLVCDAVQAAGRVPTDIRLLGADVLTVSAHKLGGPRGIGALVLRPDIEMDRLIGGGGQEMNRRAGTENLPGIAGFAAAVAAVQPAIDAEASRLLALRERVEAGIEAFAPEAVVFGRHVRRLPNTILVAFPGLPAETLLMALDLAGVAASSGSACSSGKMKRSHVLDAMRVPADLAEGAVRISLGWTSTEDDVTRFLPVFERTVATLYERRRRAA